MLVSEHPFILYVKDDDAIRSLLLEVLEDEGYEAVGVDHGATALEVAATRTPALILLDFRLPLMNGWEFIQRYRATPGPHAPIVCLTEVTADPQCALIEPVATLKKPFGLKKLLETVARYAGLPPETNDRLSAPAP